MKYVKRVSTVVGLVALAAGSVVLAEPQSPPEKAPAAGATAAKDCQDLDRDGYGLGCAKGPDCNDHDPMIAPDKRELCNLRDDDCNALVDDAANCAAIPYNPQPIEIVASGLTMGSPDNQGAPDEHPQHHVALSGFSMDRYEVTNERYAACVHAGVCSPPRLTASAKRRAYYGVQEFARYPVVFVGWAEANRFCQWDGGRLPTEAEWELVARGPAPSKRIFPWGDEAPDCTKVNMGGDLSCVGDTDLVGRRAWGASPWGAMDMAGNVWEWTSDWYDADYYRKSPKQDPKGPTSGRLKVMRGGCWMSGADSLRVSCRKAELPDTWAPNVGFRCVQNKAR